MRQWLLSRAGIGGRASPVEIKSGFAAQCRKLALAHEGLFRKANFNPAQPRVPAGNLDGGRWTSDQGRSTGGVITDFSSVTRSRGHHLVPRSVFQKYPLSAETRQVFEGATTGKLYYEGNNTWDRAHRVYRDAVDEHFSDFMQRNGIQPETMTPDQARNLIGEIESSVDPRVRNFNRAIRLREIINRIRSRAIFRGNE